MGKSDDGAATSAALYSLIETAKACGLKPCRYQRHIFEKLPFASTSEDFTALLQQNLSMDALLSLTRAGLSAYHVPRMVR